MAVNYNPKIVTDGLVMYLDAANSKSYPGSGTSWNDISKSGNNATMFDSPAFNSNNNGYFTFNGSSQYVNCGTNLAFTTTMSAFFSMYPDSTWPSYSVIFDKAFDGNESYRLQRYASTNAIEFYDGANVITLGTFSLNAWNYIGFTLSSGTLTMYKNGESLGTGTARSTLTSSAAPTYIGRYPGAMYKGYIGLATVYNRNLTAVEVKQNFNAIRGRYGL